MPNIQILHNPRCSKSRQTLGLLQEQGIEPEIIEYLKNPLTKAQLKTLSKKLGLAPSEFMRKGEFAKLGIEPESTAAGIIDQMTSYPVLVERPIVINGSKAKIGRPPEDVLAIL